MKRHQPCWLCRQGNHAECDSYHDGEPKVRCECPVCHANRYTLRKPVLTSVGIWVDPGPDAEPEPDPLFMAFVRSGVA